MNYPGGKVKTPHKTEGEALNWDEYDYIDVTMAQNTDEQYARIPTVFTVEREGVPLAYVKKPDKGSQRAVE